MRARHRRAHRRAGRGRVHQSHRRRSPLLCDITEIEKITHVIQSSGDVLGFKGNVKNGGSPARQQRFVYDVSMLVIPDLAALRLVVIRGHDPASGPGHVETKTNEGIEPEP